MSPTTVLGWLSFSVGLICGCAFTLYGQPPKSTRERVSLDDAYAEGFDAGIEYADTCSQQDAYERLDRFNDGDDSFHGDA